jgi:hypothetical protein
MRPRRKRAERPLSRRRAELSKEAETGTRAQQVDSCLSCFGNINEPISGAMLLNGWGYLLMEDLSCMLHGTARTRCFGQGGELHGQGEFRIH